MSESNWKSPGYNPEHHGWWKATLDDRADLGYPVGYYYADTVRAIMIAFTNFFNDMYVIRYDEKGFPRKRIQVPIKFGPRAKSHDYRKEEESGETYYIPLPNMYYKITSFQYDAQRASSSNEIRTFYDTYLMENGVEEREVLLLWKDTQPVPYNLGIEITAKADKFSDILQIVEQITSRFNPDAFIYIKEFWFMNIRRDIKMKLDSVSIDYQDELGEQDKRELEAKFNFTIEGQVYTKIEHGAIIDQIIMKLNPSIAVYNDVVSDQYLRGDSACPEFFVDNEEYNWFKDNNVIVKDGDRSFWEEYHEKLNLPDEKYDYYKDVGIYVPAVEYQEAFELSDSANGIWKLTSAYTQEIVDKYNSIISVSGNYAPEPGTYDEQTRSWQGSMTDRYNFKELGEDDFTMSGRKDYLNSDNEKVDTIWALNHEVDIRP